MKKKSVLIIPALIVATFAILIGSSMIQNEDFSSTSDAALQTPTPQTQTREFENSQLCSLDVTVYVHEIMPDAREVILDFTKHPELSPSLWGFYDKQNTRADVLHFNRESTALYDTITTQRALSAYADESNAYPLATFSQPTLVYEKDKFEIVRHEIKDCTQAKSDMWMCSPQQGKQDSLLQQSESSLESIQNVLVDCGMKLHFGWIVRKIPSKEDISDTNTNQLENNDVNEINDANDINNVDDIDDANGITQSNANALMGDLNDDKKVNTLDLLTVIMNYGTAFAQADLNDDGIVNALDYTLVVTDIVQ